MRRISTLLMAGLCAGIFSLHTPAQAAAEISLMRLADCGTPQAPVPVNERFSDTFSYGDLKIQFVFSCYLIKHGDEYLLWDTGHSMTAPNVAPKVSIVDQLDKIGVKPEQITYVGISHYHADHTGQVASFPKATLLIGLGRLERYHGAESGRRRQLQAVRGLDQRRQQSRAAAKRQGCVRRRQCDHAEYAQDTHPAITASWSSCRRWAAW